MIRFKLYAVIILIFNLVLLFAQKDVVNTSEKRDPASTNHRGIPCATPDPTVDQIIQSKAEVDLWLSQNSSRDREQVIIYVIWHAIHASDNTGNISDSRIAGQIEAMNVAYSNNNTNISFVLDSINRVENDAWFTGWSPDAEELDGEGMQALHYDPAHYLNIYSVQLWEPGGGGFVTYGYTYSPHTNNYPESHYRQGFTIDHKVVYGGSNYADEANAEILKFAMIETKESLDNLDEIMKTKGLDGIYIGPADLSLAIGQKPSFDKPEGDPVYDVIMKILDHAKKNKIIAGIQNGQPEYAEKMIKKGFQLVTIGSDQRYMTAASKSALSKLKKEQKSDSGKGY